MDLLTGEDDVGSAMGSMQLETENSEKQESRRDVRPRRPPPPPPTENALKYAGAGLLGTGRSSEGLPTGTAAAAVPHQQHKQEHSRDYISVEAPGEGRQINQKSGDGHFSGNAGASDDLEKIMQGKKRHAFVPVDGLSVGDVERYFLEADEGKDGRVADEEARNFFGRTGLPPAALSAIWRRVKPPEYDIKEKGLDSLQFSQAMRLVAFAQQGYPMDNEELVLSAMDSETWLEEMKPLDPPVIQDASGALKQHDDGKVTHSTVDASFVAKTVDRERRSEVAHHGDVEPSIARLLRPSHKATELPPLPYDIRYPPLKPDSSAKLRKLVSIHGSLLGYPSAQNGMLQWAHAEENARAPLSDDGISRSLLMFQRSKDKSIGCKSEDSDAAKCSEMTGITYKDKQITCIFLDKVRSVMWVADRDGWVSAHDVSKIETRPLTRDCMLHQWQASRVGFVSSMTVVPSGELWTGTNRGVLRVWPHTAGAPSIESFSLDGSRNARPRELRRNGFDRAHSSEVISMECTAGGYIVWSASARTVLLWDVGSGMCFGTIKSFQGSLPGVRPSFFLENTTVPLIDTNTGMDTDPVNGSVLWRPSRDDYDYCYRQQESWASLSERPVLELTERITEGAGKAVKIIGKLGGRLAGSSSSYQSSHSSLNENEKKIEASISFGRDSILGMIATMDNSVWLSCGTGKLEKYTASGKLLDTTSLPFEISCMAEIAGNIWIGSYFGEILVLDSDDCKEKARFKAHRKAVLSITQVGIRAYSLALDGSISGWSVDLSLKMREACWDRFQRKGSVCFSRISFETLAVTWNCGESRPGKTSSFFRWINEHSTDKSLAVFCLQEVEMGGTSVAIAAAKETLASKSQERGNANAQYWMTAVLSTLGTRTWYHVALRQLSGMLILVFARKDLENVLGNVNTSSVACGIFGVGGNKGAVAVQLSLYRHQFAFICSHFAAHQNAVDIRNANYHSIAKFLRFKDGASIFDSQDEAEQQPTADVEADIFRKSLSEDDYLGPTRPDVDKISSMPNISVSKEFLEDGGSEDMAEYSLDEVYQDSLKNMDAVLWMGDFNYRIDGNFEQVYELIAARDYRPLLACDQLKREFAKGRIFKGYREPEITFQPTYKFDKGVTSALAYDSSEKRRVPAWCDRIMYRGSMPFSSPEPSRAEVDAMSNPSQNKVDVQPLDYGSWMDVTESDHKPVYACFKTTLTSVDAVKRREIVADTLAKYGPPIKTATVPRFKICPHSVRLHAFHMPEQMVTLENKGSSPLIFTILPETFTRQTAHLVEVRPSKGRVLPGKSMEIYLKANSVGSKGKEKNLRSLKFQISLLSEFSAGGSMDNHAQYADLVVLLLPETSSDFVSAGAGM